METMLLLDDKEVITIYFWINEHPLLVNSWVKTVKVTCNFSLPLVLTMQKC